MPRPREKRLVCPDLRVPNQRARVLRVGAENRRHLRKSANPRGARRPRKPAKARSAKRAAFAGHDRRNRVAKPEAAAHHRAERSTVPRNRVCVVPRKNDIRRGLKETRACASAKIWAGLIRTSEGVKPADLQSAPFGGCREAKCHVEALNMIDLELNLERERLPVTSVLWFPL